MKAVVIDFDNTLVRSGPHGLEPVPGAAEALSRMKRRGIEIIISTCRITIAAQNGSIEDELRFIESTLQDFSIPFDRIDLGNKPVATYYIDDRAIEFNGNWHHTLGILENKLK